MRIVSIESVEPVGIMVTGDDGDTAEQLGFSVRVKPARGKPEIFEITSAVFGELLTELVYQGQKVARDFDLELGASIGVGAERARSGK